MDHRGTTAERQTSDTAGPGGAGQGAGPLADTARRYGLSAAWGCATQAGRYVPHIYTDSELAALFTQTDLCRYCPEVPLRHLVMPVLFRTIYACGLRCSEARLLRTNDVDIDTGVLQIRDAKGGKDRQLPVSKPLRARLADYDAQIAGQPGRREWFFPGRAGQPLTIGNVYHNFRRFLWQARISTAGADTAPGCTICATPSRSTTCGHGSPTAATSAPCCRCCRPTWAIRRWPTPPTPERRLKPVPPPVPAYAGA